MAARAIITGITGQDGSYLTDILLSKGYEVIGVHRRSSTKNLWRVEHNLNNKNFTIESGDITDYGSIHRIVEKYQPTEFYNLAAQSHVKVSWDEPVHTGRVTGMGVTVCLEAIRNIDKSIKFYQASSSELFGKVLETPQSEKTPFNPRSPYAAAKAYGFYISNVYKESYDMFCCNGILFNHESPRRGLNFVTRKITDGVAKIMAGLTDKIILGNLDAYRDWGHALDYMNAAWLMLQQDKPDNYVISTGETHSIREFLDVAFSCVGINNWSQYVGQDEKFMRPADVNLLLGDCSKAKAELGWEHEYTFETLVEEMVAADLARYGA